MARGNGWSSISLAAAALVLAAVVAMFRFKLDPVTVLTGCALAGMALAAFGWT